ncbi:hypothetical protein IWW45_006831 [Coemansia sp. RSA 485]|nr:hypothetical protein IWW45_006831 [Coemansia sp. RSA 485]
MAVCIATRGRSTSKTARSAQPAGGSWQLADGRRQTAGSRQQRSQWERLRVAGQRRRRRRRRRRTVTASALAAAASAASISPPAMTGSATWRLPAHECKQDFTLRKRRRPTAATGSSEPLAGRAGLRSTHQASRGRWSWPWQHRDEMNEKGRGGGACAAQTPVACSTVGSRCAPVDIQTQSQGSKPEVDRSRTDWRRLLSTRNAPVEESVRQPNEGAQ